MTDTLYDAIIVGGGPAGLNAALYLGRSCRKVALIDSGDPRNLAAGVMHNMITNDGVTVEEFRRRSRADLEPYDVTCFEDVVDTTTPAADRITVTTSDSGTLHGRTLLWAAGVRSRLPEIPGLPELWGKQVFECPYCHAWEVRGKSFGVFGGEVPSECLAATLTTWSPSVTYLTGARQLPDDEAGRLRAAGIPSVTDKVLGVRADPEGVAVSLADGSSRTFGALFLHMDTEPRIGPLRDWLGAQDLESVQIDERGRTRHPRLYVAGDLGKNMQQATMAAASGGLAGMAINSDLVREDRPGSLYDLPAVPE
ncbi:NAD(P)/FAD-dependent oxidoreductase [Streptomyces harbinensis]|uniref:Thioredoxin reductase n=1 Tax=Streptomyces harbinensis TaxID=1176198 RepID=A0A1I6PMM7_9ACTN|nr:NAD(P)/FAD-dependent oxidoreductase [Streptomyces harbinensis]SFS41473.1 Thioredoxin reductase [Streptomyces harbinensis]